MSSRTKVYVCQAGSCRRAGSEAVLLEIEELIQGTKGVCVEASGCLGLCSQAPNAMTVTDTSELMFTELRDLSSTVALVERVNGSIPRIDSTKMTRLEKARRLRLRMRAREESKWNLALSGVAEDLKCAYSDEDRLELIQDQANVLAAAGLGEEALEAMDRILKEYVLNFQNIPMLRLVLDKAKLLSRLGKDKELTGLRESIDQLRPCGFESNIKAQVICILEQDQTINANVHASQRVQNYAKWHLDGITPVSSNSAVYHFRSNDEMRGTPIRKGRGGRTVWSKTWHTTLLAYVGKASNKEGPLPWIERDYTPISTAQDWEQGRCDILIKLYLEPPGCATSWLHRVSANTGKASVTEFWLSRPMQTMHVPSLTTGTQNINRKHESVLLIVAGTGVVVVPQIMHHASMETCFGGRPPIKVPVSVIYSCRRDDALLIPEMVNWCRDGFIQRCVVAITDPKPSAAAFPYIKDVDVEAAFGDLTNASSIIKGHLSVNILQAELKKLKEPLRVVITGPESFNGAVRSMLEQIGVGLDAITILSA